MRIRPFALAVPLALAALPAGARGEEHQQAAASRTKLWWFALAVAAVPEALAAVVTGALAIAMHEMAKRNALVRKRWIAFARQLGLTTSLDPQWDSSGQWQYMDEWMPLLTWLFVNQDEAMSISASPRALARAAMRASSKNIATKSWSFEKCG